MAKKISKEFITQKYINRNKENITCLTDCESYEDLITLHCSIHNYTWKARLGSNLYKKYSCPKCATDNALKSRLKIYDLNELRPDVVKLFYYPENTIGLSECSRIKKYFKCPNCGAKLYKSILNVSKYGLSCNICSDGFSYPNKLMFCILSSLKIDFIAEFSPDWISPKRYDFKFKKYIIEMDGGLGHGKKSFGKKTVEETLYIDKIKDDAALNHGYKIIRINCDESDKDFIKSEIYKSELKNLLELDKIDWDFCDKQARKSMLINVCEYYDQHRYLSIKELIDIFHLSKETIKRYLRIGYKYGLCSKYQKNFNNQIICLDSMKIFSSYSEAADFYNIDSSSIRKCCIGKYTHTHNLHFIYLKDYNGNIDEIKSIESIKPSNYSNKKRINEYNNQSEFIATYESMAEASEKTNISFWTIRHSCYNKYTTDHIRLFYFANDPNQPDKSKIAS